MEHSQITTIIKKFLEGNCSDEELAYLLYWYESFDEQADIPLSAEEKQLLRNKILARIQHNIPALKSPPDTATARKPIHRRRWMIYAVAAGLALVIAWPGIRYYLQGPTDGQAEQLYSLTDDHAPMLTSSDKSWQQNNMVTLDNNSNRIHHVILPDSSEVWLSPHSKIEYPEAFVEQQRLVHLQGEAFFDIASNPEHPFVVKSGELVTKVLGTSFLLKAYSGKPIEVAVVTGKVVVSRETKTEDRITLISNQKAILRSGRTLIKLKDPAHDLAVTQRWQKIDLSFNNISFDKVTRALEHAFNVHIKCRQKEIYAYSLNADFTDQNLTSILEMLEKSLNIHYELANDSVIYISKNMK